MKISVITAVFNRAETIGDCIESVLGQQGCDLEYIVVDGMSNDGTSEIVEGHRSQIDTIIREPDTGIYDALNKGINAATGDVVGFLHADDLYADTQVLKRISEAHAQNEIEASYGDLRYVDEANHEIKRNWVSGKYNRKKFYYGWMPPHPTVYLRRESYQEFGLYNLEMPTAADYELLIRMFVKHQLRAAYIPNVLVNMRVGGSSNASIGGRLKANKHDQAAWRLNGLNPPPLIRFTKPLRKLPQFILSKLFKSTVPEQG